MMTLFNRFRIAVAFTLVVILFSLSQSVFAEVYTDIIYEEGYPGFMPGPFIGTMSVDAQGVAFKTKTGKSFLIPRRGIRRFGYEGTKQRGHYAGLTLAGGSPVALAASLGFTVVENTLMNTVFKPKSKTKLLYTIHFYLPEQEEKQEAVFQFNDEKLAKKLMDELQHINELPEPEEAETVEEKPEPQPQGLKQ